VRLRSVSVVLVALVALVWAASSALTAQGQRNDPNVLMLDDCLETDEEYDDVGGCPQSGGASTASYRGSVSVAEFFALLFSPLAPGGQIIGHPSWRNEPSYLTVKAGQTVRVTNRGGRDHTYTEVADFGGGFVPPLNGTMTPAPECLNMAALHFVGTGETQRLTALGPGLHKFQCCIHPWMRGAIRVE
jgi:plastocyanin